MDTKLFVHGTPKGQQCWGDCTDGEKRYFYTFYNNVNDDPVEFLQVDIRDEKGTSYTYYTFVRKGVLDFSGRSGGYFALTLRCNDFYKDIKNIYILLSIAYKKLCIGICLKELKGTPQFIISDFTKVDSEWTKIKEDIVDKFIENFSNESDLESIDRVTGFGQHQKINLFDCTPEIAEECCKKSGLKVSLDYPSLKPDPKDKKIERLTKNNNTYQQQISEQQQQILELTNKLSNSEDRLKKLDDKVYNLSKSQDELHSIKSKIGDVRQQFDKIFDDLEQGELDNNSKMEDDESFDDETFNSRNPAGKEHPGKVKTKKKICLFIILILTILFIIIFLFLYHSHKMSKQAEADEAIEVVNSKSLQFYKENQDTLVINKRGTVVKKEGTWIFDPMFKRLNNIYVLKNLNNHRACTVS
jgi:hypothetical protein